MIGDRRRVPGRKLPPVPLDSVVGKEPGEPLESPSHDQWLLDEALAETFPASDPISPSTKTSAQAE